MPAFSFSKQKKQSSFVKFDKCVPTVGKYDVSDIRFNSRIKTAPSVSLPKAERYSQEKIIIPGPGAYDTQRISDNNNKGISMKGTHQLRIRTQGPSPGQYNPLINFPTKKFTFPKSSQKKLPPEGPHPASYNIKLSALNSTHSYIFPKAQKEDLEKKTWMTNVGPGYHEINQKIKNSQKDKFSFTKTQKFNNDLIELKEKVIVPGPGKYDLKNPRQTHSSIKFALAAKTMSIQTEVPGPGAYQLSDKSDSVKGIKIGHQNRQFNYTSFTPGPGSYQVQKMLKFKQKQPTIVFPKSPKNQLHNNSFDVGPGNYNIPSQIDDLAKKKKGFTILGKHSREKIQKTPGPQSYNPDFSKVHLSCEKSVFDRSRKLSFNVNLTPGPGHYQKREKNLTKTFYFNKADSRSLDQKKLQINVGPGKYFLKPFFGQFDGKQKLPIKKQTLFV